MSNETPYRTDMPEDPVFVAIDSETTGRDPEDAEVVEAGLYVVESQHSIQNLFKPVTPIPPEAMGVHHITNEMVENEPSYEDDYLAFALDMLGLEPGRVVFVAHNAAYDAQIMDYNKKFPWLCTWRLALHFLPMAGSHGLQALRYGTGIEPQLPSDLYPHRALYDAIVCGDLLQNVLLPEYMATGAPVSSMSAYAEQPVRLMGEIKFGKHRGMSWSEVPSGYLNWIIRQGDDFDKDVNGTAKAVLEERRKARHG